MTNNIQLIKEGFIFLLISFICLSIINLRVNYLNNNYKEINNISKNVIVNKWLLNLLIFCIIVNRE